MVVTTLGGSGDSSDVGGDEGDDDGEIFSR